MNCNRSCMYQTENWLLANNRTRHSNWNMGYWKLFWPTSFKKCQTIPIGEEFIINFQGCQHHVVFAAELDRLGYILTIKQKGTRKQNQSSGVEEKGKLMWIPAYDVDHTSIQKSYFFLQRWWWWFTRWLGKCSGDILRSMIKNLSLQNHTIY